MTIQTPSQNSLCHITRGPKVLRTELVQTTRTGNIVIGSSAITTGSQDIIINRPLTIGYITSTATSFSQSSYFQSFTSSGDVAFVRKLVRAIPEA